MENMYLFKLMQGSELTFFESSLTSVWGKESSLGE